MADKLMYIPNDNSQNYHFCILQLVAETRLDTQLNAPTNQNSKVPKVVKSTNKNCYY